MRLPCLLLFVAATVPIPQAGAAAAPSPPPFRAPTEKWVIDYAEHQCTANRAFGSAEKPLYLILKPSPGATVMQIALVEKGQNSKGIQDRATLTMSDGRQIEVTQLVYGVSNKRYRTINLDTAQTATLAASTTLRWTGNGDEALTLGSMAKVMQTLEDCRRDLRKYWSIGDENANGRRSGPKIMPALTSMFSGDDYPTQASSRDQQGTAGIIMLIDEKGSLRDCMVEQTSGVASLDITACLVIRRNGKFSPALDSDGKPVKGAYTQRIKWLLPSN